jgi:predicted  nucleic acid-binding Zn-ribbon protein
MQLSELLQKIDAAERELAHARSQIARLEEQLQISEKNNALLAREIPKLRTELTGLAAFYDSGAGRWARRYNALYSSKAFGSALRAAHSAVRTLREVAR